MPALGTVYGWELRKLVAQKRTYLGLAAAALVPVVFVVALALQSGQPNDVAFGRYVRQSGLAILPVILIFGSIWLFPLITALVAGDIVAAEDHNGTLKTILTRSVGRGRIFTAKVLASFTYALAALVVMGVTAVVGGILKSGLHPLTTLSGTTVGPGKALVLIPLTITKIDDLDFGSIVPSATAGTVTINPTDGSRTFTGGVTLVPGDAGFRAYFGGAGSPNQQVLVALSPPVSLSDGVGDIRVSP